MKITWTAKKKHSVWCPTIDCQADSIGSPNLNSHEWIKNFFTKRRQTVSIRGRVLYYINDLVEGLECPVLLFANDTKIFKEIKLPADAETLKRDVKKIEEWSNKWPLNFKEDKCATMHIHFLNLKDPEED